MLHADPCVHEAQVLGDLGDGGDGGLACALGDPLFDRHSGCDAIQLVDLGAGHLLNELTGIGRHGFHETTLSLSEDNIGGEDLPDGNGDDREGIMTDTAVYVF